MHIISGNDRTINIRMSIILWTDIMYYFRNATHFMKWQNALHKEFTSFCDMSECFTERMPIILWNDTKLADYFLKSKNAISFSNHLVTHYCNQKSRNVRLHTPSCFKNAADLFISKTSFVVCLTILTMFDHFWPCLTILTIFDHFWPCLTIWPFMFDHFWPCLTIWPFMFDHFLKCILINWWSFRTL